MRMNEQTDAMFSGHLSHGSDATWNHRSLTSKWVGWLNNKSNYEAGRTAVSPRQGGTKWPAGRATCGSSRLIVAQLVNRFPAFYGTWKFITMFTGPYPELDEFGSYPHALFL